MNKKATVYSIDSQLICMLVCLGFDKMIEKDFMFFIKHR